ncbi:hypothetical protein TWF751_006753 [Orbilia oligospora]|nr:hypothetical protein TWF751_006753 [Orbilia oligospora]
MFISALKFSALLFLATIPPAFDASTCLELSDEEVFKAGECTIKVLWQKVQHWTSDLEPNNSKLRDRIAAEVYDARGTKISTQTLKDFEFCTGHPGGERKVQSGLGIPILLSPQHRREYLQFWFGNLGWHTDPFPRKGPSFVGDDVKDRRPWCSVNMRPQWMIIPFNRADGGLFSDPTLHSIVESRIECIFQCERININVNDLKPCVTPPPPTTVTATETNILL